MAVGCMMPICLQQKMELLIGMTIQVVILGTGSVGARTPIPREKRDSTTPTSTRKTSSLTRESVRS